MFRHRSYLAITLHLVWATEGRQPYLTEAVERKVYAYFASVVQKYRCDVLAIGGTEDHVHLVITFAATVRLQDLMRDLKGGSSNYIRTELLPNAGFFWQDNYGAFSVSPADRDRIITYVKNQKTHHAQNTLDPDLERERLTE